MISKEKQIFLESFDRRNLKRDYIETIMNIGLDKKRQGIRKMREESYQELIDDLSKRKSFDKTLMNQKTSPTSRTPVRSWKQQQLNEQDEFDTELDKIIEELEEWDVEDRNHTYPK